ncbi:MAG: CHAT domain-containing protein [Anaerolineales bacterium]
MPATLDLDITLSRLDVGRYLVEVQYNDPDALTRQEAARGPAQIDLDVLAESQLDLEAYSRLITAAVFADETLRGYFKSVRANVQSAGKQLRVRLAIDRSALELHALRWELLRDPETQSPLAVDRQVYLSRFLASQDWEPIQLRSKNKLRALAAVANPSDLAEGKYQVGDQTLPAVDVQSELERARQGLSLARLDELASDPAAPGTVSLDNLVKQLSQGYDLLYLVCHGAHLTQQGPPGTYLWLEDEQGKGAVVAGDLLAERIRMLPVAIRPQLVVLVSCQSAGDGGVVQAQDAQGALAALGPRLIRAGVPAVMAMHGSVTMETIEKFMPAFFTALNQDGQLDAAMAAGRSVVSDRDDWWMPVLYMRLRDGRIWYEAGFTGAKDDFTKWNSLVGSVVNKKCTVVVGPGLLDPIIGNQREIARRWAEKHGYPLSPSDQEELPRIAQFIATMESKEYLRTTAYQGAIRDELTEHYGDIIPEDWKKAPFWALPKLNQAFVKAVDSVWNQQNPGPYQLLARLEQKIYLTANTSTVLEDALSAAGKHPEMRLCRWNDKIPEDQCIYTETPDPEKPLVYHLFGRMDFSESLVLTEDDYFDFLIGMAKYKDFIPSDVQNAMLRNSLVFLGFKIDDWQFRTFFRMIMAFEGKDLLADNTHAAAQIEPQENRIQDIQRAHDYLEEYFKSSNISLYEGSPQEFLETLVSYLE